MSFIAKVTSAFRPDGSDATTTDSETLDDNASETTTRPSSRLFRCTTCAKTYVTLSMETCPDCNQSIEGIPNERDLGMV